MERDRIKASQPDLLRAYNTAVATEFDKLKMNEPEKLKELQDLMDDLKQQAKLSFVEQTESVQAA